MIYFVRVKGTDYFKIGRAGNVKSRLITIATDNYQPVELCLTLEIATYHDANFEKDIHAYFSKLRVKGEWFRLTIADIDRYLQRHRPNIFTDFSKRQRVHIHCSVENYIPDEISFPSQQANI